jgi:hypothetical protein
MTCCERGYYPVSTAAALTPRAEQAWPVQATAARRQPPGPDVVTVQSAPRSFLTRPGLATKLAAPVRPFPAPTCWEAPACSVLSAATRKANVIRTWSREHGARSSSLIRAVRCDPRAPVCLCVALGVLVNHEKGARLMCPREGSIQCAGRHTTTARRVVQRYGRRVPVS